jgi:hypothetical protein
LSGRAWLRLGIGVLLAIALLFFSFREMKIEKVWEALLSADPLLLAGVVAASVLTYVLRAWRWGYLLAPMARVPFAALFSATVVGFLSGLAIPRAGEVLRPYLVARRHPVSVAAGLATIVLERLFDLIIVLLLLGAYFFVLPTPAAQVQGTFTEGVKLGGAVAALGSVAILGVLFVLHSRAEQAFALAGRLLQVFPGWLASLAGRLLKTFTEGLGVLKAPASHLLAITAQSFLVWLSIGLAIWLNNLAFGVKLPFHATFLIIAFLTVGVAIPTPGNVGGFHGFFILALSSMFGVGEDQAGAAALSSHALTNLPVLVLGFYYLGREGLSLGRVAAMTENKAAGALPAQEVS